MADYKHSDYQMVSLLLLCHPGPEKDLEIQYSRTER